MALFLQVTLFFLQPPLLCKNLIPALLLKKNYRQQRFYLTPCYLMLTRWLFLERPVNNVKNYVPINPLTAEWALRALVDFTQSNARRLYSSMGNLLDGKGLIPWYLEHICMQNDLE